MTEEKVRENRIRRMAGRQGFVLVKSRRRDERALDYGLFDLVNASGQSVMTGETDYSFKFTLDQVEAFLLKGDAPVTLRKA